MLACILLSKDLLSLILLLMNVLLILRLFPVRISIPPYIHASILSCVKGSNLSKKSIKIDRLIVPIIDFSKNLLPIFTVANKNKGIFKASIVVPIGILKM